MAQVQVSVIQQWCARGCHRSTPGHYFGCVRSAQVLGTAGVVPERFVA